MVIRAFALVISTPVSWPDVDVSKRTTRSYEEESGFIRIFVSGERRCLAERETPPATPMSPSPRSLFKRRALARESTSAL